MMFNNSANYYKAMDGLASTPEPMIMPMASEDESALKDAINFGTAELGTTTNPMGNTLESVNSRIREGVGRLEFSFIGKGKGNAQSPTPESFGTRERQDMRELLTINDIKASVHASVHSESLAGFGQGGFNGAQREEAMREIKRAIDFAGDVTDGGAIVFHLSEWQRPMTYAGKRTLDNESSWMFKGYDTEEKDSQLLVVDQRTGKFIEGIQKDKIVYQPNYETVGSKSPDLIGQRVNGRVVEADDWVDVEGNPIPKFTKDTSVLFNRVPVWNSDNTNFDVRKMDWNAFVDEAKEWNAAHPETEHVTPEYLFAKTELENKVLQLRGSSLYHAQSYEEYRKRAEKLREALRLYEAYEGDIPEDALESLKKDINFDRHGFTKDDHKLPTEIIKDELKSMENHMRHIHESSSSADAQAQQTVDMINNMKTAEEYGMEKTAESVAKVGLMAREQTHRRGLKDALYAAPENYDQHLFGSHPEEMRRVVEASRQKMAEQLMREKKVGSVKQGLSEAKKHIQATLDIGHMNMWRQHFDPVDKDGNSLYNTAEAREKAFEKWLMKETEGLVKDGVVGHIHLADNFGYGDEHLTPGQGNVPMKEFLKNLEKHGLKDIIIEPGSYNVSTALPDTLSLVGSPIYGLGRGPRFNQMQHKHFGYNAPGFFIAGAYVPSNDWRPWSDVPLE